MPVISIEVSEEDLDNLAECAGVSPKVARERLEGALEGIETEALDLIMDRIEEEIS